MAAYGPNVALDVDEAAAEVAVKHLGWAEERAERRSRVPRVSALHPQGVQGTRIVAGLGPRPGRAAVSRAQAFWR